MSKRDRVITEPVDGLPSLTNLLPPQRILVGEEVRDWRDAVRVAGELLLADEAITAGYIDAMVRTAEELDQYIVVAPGVALPHARPEDGALVTALSLVTLNHPVEFGHPTNDPVRLVFALSAPDKNVHVRAMKVLANLLLSNDLVRDLEEAGSAAEIHALITRVEDEGSDD